jgi:integrase
MASVFKRKGRPHYLASWFDEIGRRRERSTKTTDRRAAERIARKWEADALLRAEGVVDPAADRLAQANRKPLAEHVAAFIESCERSGQARTHTTNKRRDLQRFIADARLSRLSDITPERLESYLHALTVEKATGERDDDDKPIRKTVRASARTRNAVRASVSAFAAWCVQTHRLASNPVRHVKPADERTDRRRVRRALTDDELGRLLDVAREADAALNSDSTYPHKPSRRALWYLLAARAGLRRGDLQRLRWGDLDLDAGSVTLTEQKAKRTDTLPLHPQVVDELRAARPVTMTPAALAGARVFPHSVTNRTRQRDFERAGIGPDDAGRVADLHSLRATMATALAKANTPIAVTQQLGRLLGSGADRA